MTTDGRRDTLATAKARPDQVIGVIAVRPRTRLTARRSPSPARLEDHAVRLIVGRVFAAKLSTRRIHVLDLAGQPHRPATVASAGDLLRPPGVLARVGRPSHDPGQRHPCVPVTGWRPRFASVYPLC